MNAGTGVGSLGVAAKVSAPAGWPGWGFGAVLNPRTMRSMGNSARLRSIAVRPRTKVLVHVVLDGLVARSAIFPKPAPFVNCFS